MLKTGIKSTAYLSFNDYEAGMQKMRAHGYDCIDYQGFLSYQASPLYKMSDAELKKYLTDFKNCAEKKHLKVWQLHGCWPHVNDLTAEGRTQTIEYFKKGILGANYLNCPYVVVHPCMSKGWASGTEEEMFEANVQLLQSLCSYAEEMGVVVCLENMPFAYGTTFSTIRELKNVVRELNSPCVKVCLDTGHLNVSESGIYESIMLLGEDLAVLHVHDDDSLKRDRHLIPYLGQIEWNEFIRGLRDISFKGCISLETSIPKEMPSHILEPMQIQLANIAKYFAEEIEK